MFCMNFSFGPLTLFHVFLIVYNIFFLTLSYDFDFIDIYLDVIFFCLSVNRFKRLFHGSDVVELNIA